MRVFNKTLLSRVAPLRASAQGSGALEIPTPYPPQHDAPAVRVQRWARAGAGPQRAGGGVLIENI